MPTNAGPKSSVAGAELPPSEASVFQLTTDSTAPYCLTPKRLFSRASMLCPVSIPVCSLLSSPVLFLSHSGKLCEAKKVLPTPFFLPRLNVPGVKLELGPLCATGVDGTEPVACTAMSVLSAATELGMGVLGFSCFCCTANSCRKSARGKEFRLSLSTG